MSTNGGTQPRWRKDGRELFYLSLDGKLMAVPLQLEPTLEPGVPKMLFQTSITSVDPVRDQYDATADGQRFTTLSPVGAPIQNPIIVVLNWTAGLKK